jgi:hypothetical protein
MAAACIDHFSNGRFVLGLGSSTSSCPAQPQDSRHPTSRSSSGCGVTGAQVGISLPSASPE